MRILIDSSVGECCWQEGRVAMTVELGEDQGDETSVTITSSGADGAIMNATAWQMNVE